MSKFVDEIEFVTHSCGECGVLFAMTRDFQEARKKTREVWHCPNGHVRVFTGSSEADKLRAEVQRKDQMLEAERARSARIEQERSQVAKAHHRMRTRVMNGVCPCCNRTFQNLMQHMKTEHEGEFSLRNVREAFGMSQSAVAAEVGVKPMHVSLHERGQPVVGYARDALESWVDRQAMRTK